MSQKKFYAVAKGRKPGIYSTWQETREQIDGFGGALYKGFLSYKEAEDWIKSPSISTFQKKSINTLIHSDPVEIKDGVIIYTDGGSSGNPGPGGYGIVQVYNGKKKELSGGFRFTTNNRMELMAVIVALRELEYRDIPVTLYTDSSYVVNGINKGWAKKWRQNNWIKSDKQPAINVDLWDELLTRIEAIDINFIWVKGHSGNPLNERCDELAVRSSRLANLPDDPGYIK